MFLQLSQGIPLLLHSSNEIAPSKLTGEHYPDILSDDGVSYGPAHVGYREIDN